MRSSASGGDVHGPRVDLAETTRRYDRLARSYRYLEPLYLIHDGARRRAVEALRLRAGDTVLEVGCGTGRNFRHLAEAVGPTGTIVGVDASPGMLGEARELVERRRLANVELIQADAAELELGRPVDAVLFSLSYSVIPEPARALARAWEPLRPGRRVVVMDEGIPDSALGRLLDPIGRLLLRLAPGDPYSRPWLDLAHFAPARTRRFLLGIYYVCVAEKPGGRATSA